jgi:hypothetical protein
MTVGDWLGSALGLLGLAATLAAMWDARRQRSRREKAVIAATSVIDRLYGLLQGMENDIIKNLGPDYKRVIDDNLGAINQRRDELKNL